MKTSHTSEDRQDQGTIPIDTCNKAVDYGFSDTGGISSEFHGWTSKTANIGTAIRQIPSSTIILVWKIRFKNQVTACFDCPSDAM